MLILQKRFDALEAHVDTRFQCLQEQLDESHALLKSLQREALAVKTALARDVPLHKHCYKVLPGCKTDMVRNTTSSTFEK